MACIGFQVVDLGGKPGLFLAELVTRDLSLVAELEKLAPLVVQDRQPVRHLRAPPAAPLRGWSPSVIQMLPDRLPNLIVV